MSIFHRMKKAVVGTKQEAGTASLCPEYDSVTGDFEALHEVMIRIRQQLLTYREANSRMWTSATSLSTEFANMLEPAAGGDSHPYTAMATTLKASHAQLPAEREKLDTMLNACLFPLKEQLGKYEELKVRMQEHDKQKGELIYYQGKVSGLRTSREQSKKSESAADREKYDRNVKKMVDQETAFHDMDMQLTQELRYAFEHRVAVLGPIMLAFVCAEREIANRYTQAINEVQLVDVNEANAWLTKHEAAMAAKQGTVVTTETTVIDSSPAATVVTKKKKKAVTTTTAPVTVVPDLVSGASLANISTSGVVISEPQFASTNGTADPFGPASADDPFAVAGATQLQSPRSPNAFDNFEPSFSNAPAAFSDPFYSTATTSTAATSTPATTHTTTAVTSIEPVTAASATTAAVVDDAAGVPYTIGSTATHTAPSSTSTLTATTTTTGPAVNGTSSDFPIESSSTTHSAASTATADVLASPAVTMDDMTLEKTRGADQLDALHATTTAAALGDMDKSEKMDVATHETEPYAGSGVGQKEDMRADVLTAPVPDFPEFDPSTAVPTHTTTTTTTTEPSTIV